MAAVDIALSTPFDEKLPAYSLAALEAFATHHSIDISVPGHDVSSECEEVYVDVIGRMTIDASSDTPSVAVALWLPAFVACAALWMARVTM